jgi:hypothetical protein
MKAWSAALAAESGAWPQVTTRSFFGFTALYLNHTMFALLPRTRGMESANALAFRMDAPTSSVRTRLEKDRRIGHAEIQKARWLTFELSSDSDLHDALGWLEESYRSLGKSKNPK